MTPILLDDIESLVVFAMVAEHGSLSAAARELGVAPAAVSKRIAGLERRLSARLLVRTTRRVNLSHDGLLLHKHAAAMLAAWREANGTHTEAKPNGGLIRINAPGIYAERILLPFVKKYADIYPEIICDITCDDRMTERETSKFDVIIRITSNLGSQTMVARTLARDRLVLVGSPEYLDQFGVPLEPYELLAHRCLRYTLRSTAEEWRFMNGDVPISLMVKSVFAASDDLLLRSAAIAGMGLTIMPSVFVKNELRDGTLLPLLESYLWQPERSVSAILIDGRLAYPWVRRFVRDLSLATPTL